jgi:hypothetical protein
LRLPDKLYSIYKSYPKGWKKIAKTQLEFDDTTNEVVKLMRSNLSIKEQIQKMVELGYSRATYFRYKQKVSQSQRKEV